MTRQGQQASTVNSIFGCLEGILSGCQMGFWNLLFLVGIMAFIYMAVRDYRLTFRGETAVGTVVAMDESSSPEGGCCTYAPVVQFIVDGQAYTFESKTASYPPKYEIGDEVDVRYDPNNPQRADVAGNIYWLLWAAGAGALTVTLVFIDIQGIRRVRRGESFD